MKRAAGCFGLVLLALALGARGACADPAPRAKGFEVGERASYRVSWIGIPVGHVRAWMVGKGTLYGRPVYHIVVTMKTNKFLDVFFKVRDRLDTFVDAETLYTLRSERVVSEGGYRADEIMDFDHGLGRARYHSRRNGSTKYYTMPRGIFDAVGACYWFRRVPRLRRGGRIPLVVMYDEKQWPLAVDVEREEKVALPEIGHVDAIRLKPVLRKREIKREEERLVKKSRVRIWISTDGDRVPLRIKSTVPIFGFVDAKLERKETVPPPSTGLSDAALFG